MAQPCCGWSATAFRIRRSSVPWGSSNRSEDSLNPSTSTGSVIPLMSKRKGIRGSPGSLENSCTEIEEPTTRLLKVCPVFLSTKLHLDILLGGRALRIRVRNETDEREVPRFAQSHLALPCTSGRIFNLHGILNRTS